MLEATKLDTMCWKRVEEAPGATLAWTSKGEEPALATFSRAGVPFPFVQVEA